jgi:hypothetical protein
MVRTRRNRVSTTTRWAVRITLVLSSLALVGCTTFTGVKPVYPDVGNPNFPSVVDSLQPTFQWEPRLDADSYDFAIFESIRTDSLLEGIKRSVGKQVYYREELRDTKHRLEEPLKPATEYYWSVRVRRGSNVSPWSLYHYTLFLGTGYTRASNFPFIFKTPKGAM